VNETFSSFDDFNKVISNVTYINFIPHYTNANPAHPATVEIVLKLMSKDNWNKWVKAGKNENFRTETEKKFTRLVQIDERI
jgi:hypothetical protein